MIQYITDHINLYSVQDTEDTTLHCCFCFPRSRGLLERFKVVADITQKTLAVLPVHLF